MPVRLLVADALQSAVSWYERHGRELNGQKKARSPRGSVSVRLDLHGLAADLARAAVRISGDGGPGLPADWAATVRHRPDR